MKILFIVYLTFTGFSLFLGSIYSLLFLIKEFKIENDKLKIIKNYKNFFKQDHLLNSFIPIFNLGYIFYISITLIEELICNFKDDKSIENELKENFLINHIENIKFYNLRPNYNFINEEIKEYNKRLDIFLNEKIIINDREFYKVHLLNEDEINFFFIQIVNDLKKMMSLDNLNKSDFKFIKKVLIESTEKLEYINEYRVNEIKEKEKIKLNPELKIISEKELISFNKIIEKFNKTVKIDFENIYEFQSYEKILNKIDKLKNDLINQNITKELYIENKIEILNDIKDYNKNINLYKKEISKIEVLKITSKYK